MAVDALKRATSVDDKEAIIAAIKTTKLDTIGGPIDFTAPVVGATPAVHRSARATSSRTSTRPRSSAVSGAKARSTPFELTIVSNAAAKDLGIPVQDKVQAYV